MSSTRSRGTASKSLVAIVVLAGIATFGLVALLTNIFERKQEAQNPFFRVVELNDSIDDPAIWGKNFPFQYDSYLRTVDMTRTKHGGSESIPRLPDARDPRVQTARSKLDYVPQLRRMWAGYAFAVDFREARGHAYMLEDQTFTQRVDVVQQPGTCIGCHASIYAAYMEAGNGDLVSGFEALNKMTYEEARQRVKHPIACIDCHDSQTMALRITRPAFAEGIRAAKAAEGIADYDVNTMATRQEMRSYVCAQCHVEYHFRGDEKRLVFPWSKGLGVENALAYYDEIGFKDWTHADTGAPTLKAQHPEFEMWTRGTHGRAGVSCSDCHMPYTRVGALKVSDHHVQSPLLNINNACQTCHQVDEAELLARAETIQDRNAHLTEKALNALVDLIDEIKAAREAGTTDAQLAEVHDLQRKASFYVDWVEAENSSGFHADQEAARILAESINFSRLGQLALRDIAPGSG